MNFSVTGIKSLESCGFHSTSATPRPRSSRNFDSAIRLRSTDTIYGVSLLNVRRKSRYLSKSDHIAGSSIFNLYANQFETTAVESEVFVNSHNCKRDGCERVVINVSGMIFETTQRTLRRLPDTLLGNEERMRLFWDNRRKEYFFDRHRPSFAAILFFYQSGGKLKRPYEVPPDVFLSELEFFEMGTETITKFRIDDGYILEQRDTLPENPLKRKIWLLFNRPDSSRLAYFISVTSVIAVVLSVAAFCGETVPAMAERYSCHFLSNDSVNGTRVTNVNDIHSRDNPFFVIETVCVSWFTVEYVLGFYSCVNKWRFVRAFLNILDLLAIVPYVFMVVSRHYIQNYCDIHHYSSIFAIVRCVRVMRIFKLTNYFKGLRVLIETIRASYKDLATFFMIFAMAMVTFSALMFQAEHFYGVRDQPFQSIPGTFWYTVVTMTTVGYGDVTPITIGGKIIGSFCVVSGVLVISLSLPVFVTNFTLFYARSTGRQPPTF